MNVIAVYSRFISVHSVHVVWLQDTLCEAAVTDEPGTGNYAPSTEQRRYGISLTQLMLLHLSLYYLFPLVSR